MNAESLEPYADLPYLGHNVAFNNSNWAALYHKLWKAQSRLGMVAKVLTRTGVTVRSQETIYKVVVQTVLLDGSESWVVMGFFLKVMDGFHLINRRCCYNC